MEKINPHTLDKGVGGNPHTLGKSAGVNPYTLDKGVEGNPHTLDKGVGVKSVIICGMGGSALPGYALDSWSRVDNLPLDIRVWSSYNLPPAIRKSVLVFCVSHSGNTEETISSFEVARRSGHKVFVVTTGGKLGDLAQKARVPMIKILSNVPPRMAIAEMILAILQKLEALGATKLSSADLAVFGDFNPVADKKLSLIEEKVLRLILSGQGSGGLAIRAPVIYTPYEWYAVGHIWKIVFNETAKIPAFSYTLPEANHNEMEGFAESPTFLNHGFCALFLDFKNSNPRIQKRIILSQKIWQSSGIATLRVSAPQNQFWATFLNTISHAYAISRAIAEIRGVDPSATNSIERFKQWMAKARG